VNCCTCGRSQAAKEIARGESLGEKNMGPKTPGEKMRRISAAACISISPPVRARAHQQVVAHLMRGHEEEKRLGVGMEANESKPPSLEIPRNHVKNAAHSRKIIAHLTGVIAPKSTN